MLKNFLFQNNFIKKDWNALNILNQQASRVGAIDLGVYSITDNENFSFFDKLDNNVFKFIYLLGADNISFDNFSNQLIDLIDELKMKKIHLIGFSIGSLIARNFASKFNDRLESLTLLCSIFNRTEKQQQIVKDRFELVKKSKSLSEQALKRWFTDEYLEKNPKRATN